MRWWYVLVFQQLLTEDGFKSTGPLTFWGKAAVKLSPKSTRKVTEMAWKTSPRRRHRNDADLRTADLMTESADCQMLLRLSLSDR